MSSGASDEPCTCPLYRASTEMAQVDSAVEQIIRPTGLVDPQVVVKPTKGQIDPICSNKSSCAWNGTNAYWSQRSPNA